MMVEGLPCDFGGTLCPVAVHAGCEIRQKREEIETELYLGRSTDMSRLDVLDKTWCDAEKLVGRKLWPDGMTPEELLLASATERNT